MELCMKQNLFFFVWDNCWLIVLCFSQLNSYLNILKFFPSKSYIPIIIFFIFSCCIDKIFLKKTDILLNSLRHLWLCFTWGEGLRFSFGCEDVKKTWTLCKYKATQVIRKNYKNVLKSIFFFFNIIPVNFKNTVTIHLICKRQSLKLFLPTGNCGMTCLERLQEEFFTVLWI